MRFCGWSAALPSRSPTAWDTTGFHISGTGGVLEWKRTGSGKPLLWLADGQMHDLAEMDWGHARTDAPAEARGSGHGDADYYVHVSFRDAVLGKTPFGIRRLPSYGYRRPRHPRRRLHRPGDRAN